MVLALLGLMLAAAGKNPLNLLDDFDPESFIAGTGHEQTRQGAEYAEKLLARGNPGDIALAVRVLDTVIACQDQRPGARHEGNFTWGRNDKVIRDLNAAEFVMRHLIPMMLQHGSRLPEDARERVLHCIRLAVDEIRRMDVAVTYTNIAAMDCLNSCLGGELLNDRSVAERGYAKLKKLADVTATQGTIYEFYSPGYTEVTVDALHRLAENVKDEPTAVRARTMAARLVLTTALHIQHDTGRLAGPWSRAYFDQIVAESDPEIDYLREWAATGVAPAWIARVLDRKMPVPMQVDEASYAEWDMSATSYFADSYSLGVATRGISSQTNGLVVRYPVPGSDQPGTVFCRYLLNDPWFEASNEPKDRNRHFRLRDEGKFWAVQSGPRALFLCAPQTLGDPYSFAPSSRDLWHSMKAALVWSRRDTIEAIWAGGRRVESLPADVPQGDVVVVACGPVYVGILPLTRTELGWHSPLRIAEVENELAFEMYNYLGEARNFNELERMSRFYHGQPRCGYYLEVADRSQYADGAAFAAAIKRGTLVDAATPEFNVYKDDADRPWTVEYRRDGKTLGIEIDLIDWTLTRRWTEQGDLGYSMLESPVARQNSTGRVEVQGAVLECPAAPAWLYADPGQDFYVAGYNGEPGAVSLTLPTGRVDVEHMGTGTLVYDAGKVTIDALGNPKVKSGKP